MSLNIIRLNSNELSFDFSACDKACSTCTGAGADKCTGCAPGHYRDKEDDKCKGRCTASADKCTGCAAEHYRDMEDDKSRCLS